MGVRAAVDCPPAHAPPLHVQAYLISPTNSSAHASPRSTTPTHPFGSTRIPVFNGLAHSVVSRSPGSTTIQTICDPGTRITTNASASNSVSVSDCQRATANLLIPRATPATRARGPASRRAWGGLGALGPRFRPRGFSESEVHRLVDVDRGWSSRICVFHPVRDRTRVHGGERRGGGHVHVHVLPPAEHIRPSVQLRVQRLCLL